MEDYIVSIGSKKKVLALIKWFTFMWLVVFYFIIVMTGVVTLFVGWRYKTPQKVLFVEELTEIMINNFPDFWKLGQAYISGSLLMKEV